MAVPANSITRASVGYNVGGIACVISVHAVNSSVLTQQQWVDDVAGWVPLFIQRWRIIQSNEVVYSGISARVLGNPAIPSASFSGGGTGAIASPSLSALSYLQVDLRGYGISAAGRRRRNAWRLSGLAHLIMDDNSMMASDVTQFLVQFGALQGTLFVGNSSWLWVIAINVTRTSAQSDAVNSWNMKGSVRVLSSRQR